MSLSGYMDRGSEAATVGRPTRMSAWCCWERESPRDGVRLPDEEAPKSALSTQIGLGEAP